MDEGLAFEPRARAPLQGLRRIEGQVRGIRKMVEDDATAPTSSPRSSSCMSHCATPAIQAGPEQAEVMYDELVDLIHRDSR